MTRSLLFTTALLLTSAGVQAADKTVANRDATCHVSVPSDWVSDALPGMAHSPDKKLTIVVSSPRMIDSFAELKQNARKVYSQSKVTKDSASEFEMEGKSAAGKPDVYRAVPGTGGKFCIADVTYQGGTAEDARKIIETLGPGK